MNTFGPNLVANYHQGKQLPNLRDNYQAQRDKTANHLKYVFSVQGQNLTNTSLSRESDIKIQTKLVFYLLTVETLSGLESFAISVQVENKSEGRRLSGKDLEEVN